MPDILLDKLEIPSAPARPFEDDGVVMTASATPLLPMQVWSECEDLVAAHLAQVCAWPEEARGQGWVPGDYSFYVLEFEPTPGVKLSVQFWSEPGDKLLMEACVTGAGPEAGAYATAAVREALAARGFEAGHAPRRTDLARHPVAHARCAGQCTSGAPARFAAGRGRRPADTRG